MLKRSIVRLLDNQVTQFSGNLLEWHSWKNKFRAAIGTAGLLRIIDEASYAASHPTDNETIFHILQAADADGNASHLVDTHENERDVRQSFHGLMRWYEGDQLTSETAEDIRDKLSRISLNTRNTASEFIDDFLKYQKHLD